MVKILRPPLPLEVRRKMYEKQRERKQEDKNQRQEKYAGELIEVLQKVSQDREFLKEFLKDILTPREYKTLGIRWQIVKQLAKGLSQRQIGDNLKVSIATITRGSRELLDKKGGFARVLAKYHEKG